MLGNTPGGVAWIMLQSYLDEYEAENMSALHKVVCCKIIRMSSHIPYWLLSSYKVCRVID